MVSAGLTAKRAERDSKMSKWEVVKRYQVSDEDVEKFNLWYKNRMVLECVEASPEDACKVGDRIDCADTNA